MAIHRPTPSTIQVGKTMDYWRIANWSADHQARLILVIVNCYLSKVDSDADKEPAFVKRYRIESRKLPQLGPGGQTMFDANKQAIMVDVDDYSKVPLVDGEVTRAGIYDWLSKHSDLKDGTAV